MSCSYIGDPHLSYLSFARLARDAITFRERHTHEIFWAFSQKRTDLAKDCDLSTRGLGFVPTYSGRLWRDFHADSAPEPATSVPSTAVSQPTATAMPAQVVTATLEPPTPEQEVVIRPRDEWTVENPATLAEIEAELEKHRGESIVTSAREAPTRLQ